VALHLRCRWKEYLLALILTAGTLALRVGAGLKDGEGEFFLIPVIISAFLGGLGPGLFSTTIVALGMDYFLVPPHHSFAMKAGIESVCWVSVVLEGVLVSALCGTLHKWRHRAEAARKQSAATLESMRRAEAALRESEAHYRLLADNMADALWTFDPLTMRCTYISPSSQRLRGYTVEESMGQTLEDMLTPQSLETVRSELGERVKAFLAGDPAAVTRVHELEMTRKKAPPVRTETMTTFVRNKDGGVSVVGVSRDITERRKLEEGLRKSEVELRVTFENAAIGVMLVGADGKILRTNRALKRMLGYAPGELRGRAVIDVTHPDDIQSSLALHQEMIDGKRENYQLEKRYLCKGGEVIHARLTVSAVRGPDGRMQYSVGMVEDVTERKKLEEQFLRAQRLESVGALAGGIAHDLNNVLTPIFISCEMLRMKEGDEESRNLIGMIKNNARHGAELVKQVLSFARGAESGRAWVDPKQLIRDVVNIARNTFPKSIRIAAQTPKQLWMFLGDPTQLHQVLLNLCVNARDAMPEGGDLTISAGNVMVEPRLPGLDQGAKPGPHIVIKVSDTGTGMSAEIREKIFVPFFTTKEVGKGTGLGLSTTLGIVKNHGGFIDVTSELGKGSVFEVWLPAKTLAEPSAPEAAEARLPRGNGERILVVDDEASLRAMTQHILEAYGYVVLTAANGGDAMALYSRDEKGVDLVLTDIMMPVMDGNALTRALRKINPDVRVIAASGLGNPENQSKAMSAGANRFLFKPYNAEVLLNSVADVLQGRPAPAPTL
jgi:PAS domain S-box-containing protein